MLTYFAHAGHDHATEAAHSNGSIADAWSIFVGVAIVIAIAVILSMRKSTTQKAAKNKAE